MTEYLGYLGERGAVHGQVAGRAVPQVVPAEVFDAGPLDSGLEGVRRSIGRFLRRPGNTRSVSMRRILVRSSMRSKAWPTSGSDRISPFLVSSSVIARRAKSAYPHRRPRISMRRAPVDSASTTAQ